MKEKIYNSENMRIFKRAAVKVIMKTTGCQKDDIIVAYNAKQKRLTFGVNTADNDAIMHEEIDKTFRKWLKNDLSVKKTIKKDVALMEIIRKLSPQPVINQQMVDSVRAFIEGDESACPGYRKNEEEEEEEEDRDR